MLCLSYRRIMSFTRSRDPPRSFCCRRKCQVFCPLAEVTWGTSSVFGCSRWFFQISWFARSFSALGSDFWCLWDWSCIVASRTSTRHWNSKTQAECSSVFLDTGSDRTWGPGDIARASWGAFHRPCRFWATSSNTYISCTASQFFRAGRIFLVLARSRCFYSSLRTYV